MLAFQVKKERKKRKSSSPPRKVLPWTFLLAQSPKGPGRQGKFYLADQSIQVLVSCRGNIFYVYNYQFLKTEMSLVLQ